MDEREKESQVEERSEVITEEGTQRREEDEIEEGPAIGEAVAKEEERCEEDPECQESQGVCHFYRQPGSFHCGICKAAP